MSLFIASLNSGSNGNCYYAGTTENAVLIDCGISCREIVKRLKRLRLNISMVRAVFVSHEHSDHIHGVSTLARKYKLPVFITPKTLNEGRVQIDDTLLKSFTAYESIEVGDIRVTAFPKVHDACDPHSFLIERGSVTIGVFTDIGVACDEVKKNFGRCHAAFLEANYDENLLETGGYPYSLKNRIRGGLGHLSNIQAAELFATHASPGMTHLFLSHLSRENNRPRIVMDLFKKIAGKTEIVIASRSKETKLYHIRDAQRKIVSSESSASAQLHLFQ